MPRGSHRSEVTFPATASTGSQKAQLSLSAASSVPRLKDVIGQIAPGCVKWLHIANAITEPTMPMTTPQKRSGQIRAMGEETEPEGVPAVPACRVVTIGCMPGTGVCAAVALCVCRSDISQN